MDENNNQNFDGQKYDYNQINNEQGNTYSQPNGYMQGNVYNQPVYPQYNPNMEIPLTTGEWLLTMLLTAIPCVNIVMVFVWAFGNGNRGRKNYARAVLIYVGITILLSVFFGDALLNALIQFID